MMDDDVQKYRKHKTRLVIQMTFGFITDNIVIFIRLYLVIYIYIYFIDVQRKRVFFLNHAGIPWCDLNSQDSAQSGAFGVADAALGGEKANQATFGFPKGLVWILHY